MAFKLGDIVIDRIQMAMAEDFSGNPLYVLTQLADATIDITAESKEAVDKDGTLIKKFWKGKAGTFTANNAMINLNVVASGSGSDAELATVEKPLAMPKIITVKAGESVTLANYVDGTVKVNALATNGSMGKAYTKDTTASDTAFGLTTAGVLTTPTDANETQYVVRYDRTVTDGAIIKNKSDKFPGTIRLLVKALAVDPCSADTLKSCYIYLRSFQVSPETSLSLQTDAQLEYKGDLQCDYCSTDKTLYEFYWAEEDVED